MVDAIALADRTYDRLVRGIDVKDTMATVIEGLGQIWARASPQQWAEIVGLCRSHALYELLAQDPFTHRVRTKPRGYAGDAVMLDYIYRGLPPGASATPLGRAIFAYTAGMSRSTCAVRERRDLLATYIDAAAKRVHRPRVLAVACGHLREAALFTDAVQLVALDQDPASLAVVESEYGDKVELCHGSVRDILKGKLRFDGFDLIYAAGLYDYLPDHVARALTTTLASGLTTGGSLLVGNFLPAASSVGYMESLMEWTLLWRTEEELAALASDVTGSVRGFVDSLGLIAYLEIQRTA